MNFKTFSNRVKIVFLIATIFMFLALAMFITFFATGSGHNYFLLLFIWFGATSTLLFHYLLWQNLPFLQKIDLAKTNNYSVILTLMVYIALFPILAFLTLVFLFIFAIAILILLIMNFFERIGKKNNYEEQPSY